MADTSSDFFTNAGQGGAGFAWDTPANVLATSGFALSLHDSAELRLDTPLAGAEIPVDQNITNIELTFFGLTNDPTLANGNFTITGGATQQIVLSEPPNVAQTLTGGLAFWGITQLEAQNFANGLAGSMLVYQTVSAATGTQTTCSYIRCRFSYEPISTGYVITAKELGTPDPTFVDNYYTSAQGMINVPYDEMTLVWCWKGAAYNNMGNGYYILDADNGTLSLQMGYPSTGGGWEISPRSGTSYRDDDNLPGPLELGPWHCAMWSLLPGGSDAVLWVDGVQTESWVKTPRVYDPMTNQLLGRNRNDGIPRGTPGCISHVWCDNQYLDPATNWAKFFAGTSCPISLGANGELPTGSPPMSYFPNGDPTDNRGTLANWVEVGTVPTCATSPTDGCTAVATSIVFPPVLF